MEESKNDCFLKRARLSVAEFESTQLNSPQQELVGVPVHPVGQAPESEIVRAEVADAWQPPPPFQRRLGLPLILFVLTCGSTFLAGATGWMPGELMFAG